MGISEADDDFFGGGRRPWSESKHRILYKYLDAYLTVRRGSQRVIHFVDAFAGKGWYGEEQEAAPGSPLLIAHASQQFLASNRDCRLHGTFVELDPARAQALQKALDTFGDPTLSVLQGSFSEYCDQIMKSLGSVPSIFLIDPFGVKDTSLDALKPIAQRRDTELLLNLQTSYLVRLAGFHTQTQPGATAKLRRLQDTLGEDPQDPDWQDLATQFGMKGSPWLDRAVQRYCDRLRRASVEWRYVLPYAVRPRQGRRPKYYLIFATRSILAVTIMNDLVCSEDEALFAGESQPSRQFSMFEQMGVDIRTQQVRDKLVEQIYGFGTARSETTRQQIIEHFVVEQFGLFKQKHYRQALDMLLKRGVAVRDDSDRDISVDRRLVRFGQVLRVDQG